MKSEGEVSGGRSGETDGGRGAVGAQLWEEEGVIDVRVAGCLSRYRHRVLRCVLLGGTKHTALARTERMFGTPSEM